MQVQSTPKKVFNIALWLNSKTSRGSDSLGARKLFLRKFKCKLRERSYKEIGIDR